jgi:cytochrome P450
MPSATTRVATSRAARYLTHLCDHSSKLSQHSSLAHGHDHAGALPQQAQWSGTDGVIDFGNGRCTLHATSEALEMRAEAADARLLLRIQDALATRLEQIGRHDHLTVTWTQVPGPADGAAQVLGALMAPAGRADPFPVYDRARRLGPVAALGDGSILVSGYEAVDQVLRDPGFAVARLASAGNPLDSMSSSILRSDPPGHGRMRSLLSQVFTPRRITALRPAIEHAADSLLGRLAEAGANGRNADFMDLFAFPLPVTVICELLGVPPADRPRFRSLAADLTEALELSAGDQGPADAAASELAGYFTSLVAERRTAPRDDLVSALAAIPGDRLSGRELLANLTLLLVAGFETTAGLLGNGLAILLGQPDLTALLRSGQVPVAGFIEEVLRYDSPVQVTTRRASTADLTIAGAPVPPGSEVILLIGAANRDPARYPDPDRFDPTRRDIRPLSFGAGPHVCIGNSLARLEADIGFTRLLTRLPALSPAPGRPPVRRDRLVLRGYHALPILTGELLAAR